MNWGSDMKKGKKLRLFKDFSICSATAVLRSKSGLYNHDTADIKQAYTTVWKCAEKNIGKQ